MNEKENKIHEFLSIYKTLENISLSKVESGQSTIVDVLRVQLNIHEIEQSLDIIDNSRLNLYAQINEVTNQSFDTKINIVDELSNNVLLNFDIDTYRKQINLNHPLMSKIDQEIELSKSKQQMNSNMNKPMIGVGIDYSLVNPRTDANPVNNGRDIFIPKVI